jgi:hypothetical protein
MTLTTPIALLSLLALPVIVFLHMQRARSERHQVSSLSLWNFLRPQVRGQQARRIPLTWLLLLDLLIAALISMALAGPRLDLAQTSQADRHLILLLDVSTSMGAVDATPSRFAAARSDLEALIAQRAGSDLLTVIAVGRDARTIADSRAPGFEQDLAALESLVPGETGMNLEAGLALALASAHPETPGVVHIYTDAGGDAPGLSEFGLAIAWHLYGNSADNQAVVALQAVRLSDNKFQVFSRFANFGPETVTRTAVLSGGGTVLARQEVALEPGTSLSYSWELLGSPESLSIALDGADDLPADDRAFTGLPAAGAGGQGSQLSAAVVSDAPGPVLRALQVVPRVSVQVIAPEDYLPGSPFDLVAFRGYLPERWPGGLVLVVDPPAVSALLGEIEAAPVPELPFPQADPLLNEVDLGGVRWDRVWIPERTPPGLEPLLTAGRTTLLYHGRTGLTELVLLLVETADENGTPTAFARHPAFPVMVANIAAAAAGADLPPQTAAGAPLLLPPPERYPEIRIIDPAGVETLLGPDRPNAWAGLREPGIYGIRLHDQAGGETRFDLGVNAGNLDESDIAPGDWPSAIVSPPVPVSQIDQPVSLVPWLLGAIALLLLIEAWAAWR